MVSGSLRILLLVMDPLSLSLSCYDPHSNYLFFFLFLFSILTRGVLVAIPGVQSGLCEHE